MDANANLPRRARQRQNIRRNRNNIYATTEHRPVPALSNKNQNSRRRKQNSKAKRPQIHLASDYVDLDSDSGSDVERRSHGDISTQRRRVELQNMGENSRSLSIPSVFIESNSSTDSDSSTDTDSISTSTSDSTTDSESEPDLDQKSTCRAQEQLDLYEKFRAEGPTLANHCNKTKKGNKRERQIWKKYIIDFKDATIQCEADCQTKDSADVEKKTRSKLFVAAMQLYSKYTWS